MFAHVRLHTLLTGELNAIFCVVWHQWQNIYRNSSINQLNA